ncbi:lipoprotein [Spiroplasma cantharicola]|uniref:Bifunctional chitinase/lysozyme n=1 Tax=Spiroplasma cantharicola TaxID=362837 RepID=A0A0M5KLJ5_9MOLU|nr:lipoprotein [Spiroplasma cantharicola]ALD66263.1 bifunctional chitinase/lysozyme [Spiroplasma cantharicola]
MKKLLSLLGIVTLSASTGASVVACTSVFEKDDEDFETGSKWKGNGTINKEVSKLKENNIKKQISKELLTKDTSNNNSNRAVIKEEDRSSLAGKDILTVNDGEFVFSPYADMGIVEDTAEYLMKEKGKSQATREAAEKGLVNNIVYNDLGQIAEDTSVITQDSEVTLGFMQNAADTGELVPMWNAGPSKGDGKGILAEKGKETEYAQWFNDRYRNWTGQDKDQNERIKGKGGHLNPENVRISFGPFANSLWHTAWQNNKTPEELAQVIKAVGDRYNTKKFDFYFAAPYLSARGDYADSQKLLAAALKILIESDPKYDFQLSLVMSTKDGVALNEGFGANGEVHLNLIGDEIYPLYNFTKYLGMNFRLNLVTGYLTVPNDVNTNSDWELDIVKSGALKSAQNWNKLNNVINGVSKSSNFVNKRVKITPWIGRRAEAAAYNFTPKNAADLRVWAREQNFGGLGMFYISRDVPSEFIDNKLTGPAQADRNALDQNIRSGTGFEQFAYAKALNGTNSGEAVPITEVKDKQEIKNIGGIDYHEDIQANTSLDQLEIGGSWEGPSWEGGSGTNPGPGAGGGNGGEAIAPPTGPGKSLYTKWSEANPNRTSSITKKEKANDFTYFSPYLDAGLYEGNNMQSITTNVKDFDYLTLAFVQQVNNHGDYLDLSIAGTATGDEAYEWWESSQLWDKILKPMADKNKFENIKVAYGGATTGGFTDKNPWTLANKLNENNPAKAKADLKEALIGYQDSLVKLAAKKGKKVNMPKAIDFDIEGHAQELDEDNRLLAATIAEMKKEDKEWDFSLTLPVLPTGLTSVGYRVMNIFVEEFKKAGLSQSDLPVVDLMLMDYGDPIYVQAIKDGLTNFDLAKQAVNATKNNLATSIESNYGKVSIGNQGLYKLIGATPMIGVNDTVWGVFTEEDAKELYNWSHKVGLGYIGMWSMNDDRGLDVHTKKPINKSLLTHGLAYLEEYDFARAFTGDWTASLKNPKPEHKIK